MTDQEFKSKIKEYLKEHLFLNIREESYGFNGQCITIQIEIDNEVIAEGSYITQSDEG